jgi:hypothetical protein
MSIARFAIVSAICLLLCRPAVAELIYLTGGSQLVTFDTATGSESVIGRFNARHIDSLAFSPGGTLFGYGTDDETSTHGLNTIDLLTGAATQIGGCCGLFTTTLGFSLDGRLFGFEFNSLREFNTTTGAYQVLGPILGLDPGPDGGGIIEGLTVAPVPIVTSLGTYAAGTFFATLSNERLYAIDIDGRLASIVDFSIVGSGAPVFSNDGTLYLPSYDGNIYTYDFMSHSESLFGSLDGFFQGAAVRPVSVPEPGTLLLLGAGLFGIALTRRRRAA